MRRERKGVAIAFVAALVGSSNASLVRWAQEEASLTAIVFWEFVVTGGVLFAFSRSQETGKSWAAVWRHPLLSVGVGVTSAAVSLLLSYAYVFTEAATAVLLKNLSPLWSGVLGWLCLGDVLPLRTLGALALALALLVVMFLPELEDASFGAGGLGDAMALASSLMLSSNLCFARDASRRDPALSIPLLCGLGHLTAALGIVPVAYATGSTVLLPPLSVAPSLLDGLVVGTINVCNAIAPKYTTATQIGLVELSEAVLSPLWVYAIYREVPDVYTIGGGLGIILVLVAHELLDPGADDDDDAPPTDDGLLVDKLVVTPPLLLGDDVVHKVGGNNNSDVEKYPSSHLAEPLLLHASPDQ